MGVSSVWHLLAWTPRGCKFEAIDFKIDFIFFFHACDWPHPVITLVAGPSCGKKRGHATTGSMTSLTDHGDCHFREESLEKVTVVTSKRRRAARGIPERISRWDWEKF